MNNAFVIFDDKLLVTGSYTWTEYAEKFNYENAIFIDESDVVEKYKNEFEVLYDKSVVQRVRRMESSALSARDSLAEEEMVLNNKEHLPNKSNVKERSGKSTRSEENSIKFIVGKNNEHLDIIESNKQAEIIEKPLKEFVSVSFDEIDMLFGSESKLDKLEMTSLWKSKFEGKYVKWTGRVSFRGFAVYNWNKVGISHKGSSIDVNLKFDYSKQKIVMKLKVGDVVTYTGRLVTLSSLLTSYRLEDVDVLQVVR
jgi:hypothetical protein